ncbi:hypothetical protein CISG_02184 [Coccidioides immitis RMSCC 3703]|uniref:Uncharacterized protein n=1 Tax=Coccidioides immitis RMSCC 3703 TaxID=454286 RepID=A0A0J8R978_COCIT|nr:hypothetical protein CISG_02184 [Coccidioides immitis RMSCC 3703]
MPANHLSSIDIPLRLNAPAVFCTQHLAVTLFIYSDLGTAVRENPRRFSPPFHHRKGATLQKPAPKRSNAAVTFGKRRSCALPANSFDPAIRAETPEKHPRDINTGVNTEAANASSSVHALFSPHNESQGGSSAPDCDVVCMSSPRWKKLVLIWEARRRWREAKHYIGANRAYFGDIYSVP